MYIPNITVETSYGVSRYTLEDKLLENFEVYCTGTIDEQNSNNIIMQLKYLNSIDSNREITMYINSPGGDVTQGLAIYDIMLAITNPIKTVCYGSAASMGSILFVAGDTRLILPHSHVMIHDPLIRGGAGGSALCIKSISDNIMRCRENLCSILAKHCKKTLEEIYEISSNDTYFYGQEAIDFGAADEIVTSIGG